MTRFRVEPPGWFLIVLMTVALGVAIWAVAREEILDAWPLWARWGEPGRGGETARRMIRSG